MRPETFRHGTLGRLTSAIQRCIDWIGKATSILIFVLIGVLLYGVVMRYAWGRPSTWAGELSGLIYAVYFLVGGSYALVKGEHVNVNIFRQRLAPRTRALLDLVTWSLFYLFIGVIFWLGIDFAMKSIARMERSPTVWAPYIWPVKIFLPLSALLMLVVGVTKTISDIHLLWTGRPLNDGGTETAETGPRDDAQH